MTTTTLAAADLIANAKQYLAAQDGLMNRRPAGMPRAAWRMENPIDAKTSYVVRDTNFKSRPHRTLAINVTTGNPYDARVWTESGKVVESIDLRAPDADARLARYEVAR